jgi:hypothetical protein
MVVGWGMGVGFWLDNFLPVGGAAGVAMKYERRWCKVVEEVGSRVTAWISERQNFAKNLEKISFRRIKSYTAK